MTCIHWTYDGCLINKQWLYLMYDLRLSIVFSKVKMHMYVHIYQVRVSSGQLLMYTHTCTLYLHWRLKTRPVTPLVWSSDPGILSISWFKTDTWAMKATVQYDYPPWQTAAQLCSAGDLTWVFWVSSAMCLDERCEFRDIGLDCINN